MIAGKLRTPVVKDELKSSAADMVLYGVLRQKRDAQMVQRRIDHLSADIESQLTTNADTQLSTIFLKLPGIQATRFPARADAAVVN